ncbi:MAG: hypothetical protein ACYTKD_03320 [Planctomycetota bacterium]|jgi:hypothetical protein
MSPETATITIRRFVDRVRRRSRAEDAAAGGVAFVCGTCAGTVGWMLASGGAGTLAAPVLAAGCAVAFLGARRLARAVLRAPSRARVAAWIEDAMPELRDALATTVEAGPLAEVSAEYAAPRIGQARAGALLPAPARRARAWLVAGALAVLLAGCVVAFLATPDARGPEPRAEAGRGPGTADAPGAMGASTMPAAGAVRDSDLPGEAAAVDVVAAEGRAGQMTLRAVAAPRDRARGAGPADATEILVSSPQGFERAVELFMAGGRAARPSGDRPERPGSEDGPAP